MKVRKLNNGDLIEAGDVIRHDSWHGKKWFKVVRTTPKFAIVAWNDIATGKFQRVVQSPFRCCEKRDIWSSTQYSAWRPIVEEVKEEVKEQSCEKSNT